MSSVITIAFENWKAQEAATGKPVLLNEFVFANVPGLDPTKPIDRNEKLPPANQIVHRQLVNKSGLASENAVAYSVTLGAEVGDFDFNWIGLLNKESATLAMITHVPSQKKLKTQNGQQGNVLMRSFLLEFSGAAKETQITTTAETWQIDFTARLSGIDEMQRLINLDSYGAAAFFDESFEVTRSAEQYTVKKGLGYVGGLRGQLEQNQILNNLRNTKVYADFSYQGNIVSQWNTVVKITSAATLANYVDAAGFTHQVFAIASIDASGNVKDLRPMGALSDQELAALETRFKLDLSKKIDKANITHQTGNSTELVVSQQLLTNELGKKQPVGNYQPAGNYATSEALNGKFDKKGGVIDGAVTAQAVTLVRPNLKNHFNCYPPISDSADSLAYFQYNITGSPWGGRLEIPRIASSVTSKLMVVGDFGFGGYMHGLEYLKESQVADKFKTAVTQIWRNQQETTQYAARYGASFYVRSSDAFWNMNVNHASGDILISSGLTGLAPSTFNVAKLYSTLNTKTDRNGNLKASGASDELSDCRVGIPLPWPQSTAPTGYLICNGQSFNKTNYPLLALAYPSGVLPDLRGEFIRGLSAGRDVDAGRSVLSAQGDAIRNITGEFSNNGNARDSAADSNPTGAFKITKRNITSNLERNSDGIRYALDASLVVPTADENRPRNIAFLYIVRAA